MFSAGTLALTVNTNGSLGTFDAFVPTDIADLMPGSTFDVSHEITVSSKAWAKLELVLTGVSTPENAAFIAAIDDSGFDLMNTTDNVAVSGTFTNVGGVITFKPTAPLEVGKTYRVVGDFCFGVWDSMSTICDGSSVNDDSQGASVDGAFTYEVTQYVNNENGEVNPL